MENYKMSDAYYVEIVAYENDEVVKMCRQEIPALGDELAK
jgi:hypothetical protein